VEGRKREYQLSQPLQAAIEEPDPPPHHAPIVNRGRVDCNILLVVHQGLLVLARGRPRRAQDAQFKPRIGAMAAQNGVIGLLEARVPATAAQN
jgi:hypothetical protein